MGRIKFLNTCIDNLTMQEAIDVTEQLIAKVGCAIPIWGCQICALHDCIREVFPENFDRHSFYLKMYYFRNIYYFVYKFSTAIIKDI